MATATLKWAENVISTQDPSLSLAYGSWSLGGVPVREAEALTPHQAGLSSCPGEKQLGLVHDPMREGMVPERAYISYRVQRASTES
jgi:hypothetical protein